MAQPARPDLARSRSGREYVSPGLASVTAGPMSAGPLRADRPVADWTVGTALLAPVVLVGGWLVAGTLQPDSYSPVRQTMSVLAGQSGTDRWVMTAALLLVGGCQIATGAGLTGVGRPARMLLMLTGVCTLGVAASPEPATGPTPLHLAFAASCAFTTAVWPVLVARRAPARSWILSVYGCGTVTLLFAGLSGWLLIAAQDGSGDLGLLERLTSEVQGLFPLVVALAVRQAARTQATSDSGGEQPIVSLADRPQDSSWRRGPERQPAHRNSPGGVGQLERCRQRDKAAAQAAELLCRRKLPVARGPTAGRGTGAMAALSAHGQRLARRPQDAPD